MTSSWREKVRKPRRGVTARGRSAFTSGFGGKNTSGTPPNVLTAHACVTKIT